MENQFDDTIQEICRSGGEIYKAQNGEDMPKSMREEVDLISMITHHAYIPVDEQVDESIEITTRFDVTAWMRNNYRGNLASFANGSDKSFALKIPNVQIFKNAWDDPDETRLNKFRKNFLTINSANRRRVIFPAMAA